MPMAFGEMNTSQSRKDVWEAKVESQKAGPTLQGDLGHEIFVFFFAGDVFFYFLRVQVPPRGLTPQ